VRRSNSLIRRISIITPDKHASTHDIHGGSAEIEKPIGRGKASSGDALGDGPALIRDGAFDLGRAVVPCDIEGAEFTLPAVAAPREIPTGRDPLRRRAR
jgi:hypothetical protein